jgi:hypothetical protein
VNAQTGSQSAFLFQPAAAVRFHGGGGFGGGRSGGASAQNPPNGAVIDFYLSSAPSTPVTLDVVDAQGQVVHHASSAQQEENTAPAGRGRRGAAGLGLRARAGMNRYIWNFRTEGPTPLPGIFISETTAGGPMVPPGNYQVKLTADGKTYTAPLVIDADPRVKATAADFRKQYELAITLRDRVTELHRTIMQIRSARSSLDSARGSADSSKQQAIDGVLRKMSDVEGELTQVKSTSQPASLVYPIMLDAQYADLANVVESADSAPPAQVYEVFDQYERKRENLMANWKALQPTIAQLTGRSAEQVGSTSR